MKAILVQTVDGRLAGTVIEGDLLASMALRGYHFEGLTKIGGPIRKELQGQPQFSGLCGPMYGGEETPLRYEDPKAYAQLSA